MATGKGILLQNSGSCSCKAKELWKSFQLKEKNRKKVTWQGEVCHILIFDKNTAQRKMFACLSLKYKLMYFFNRHTLKKSAQILLRFFIKHMIFAKCSNSSNDKCYPYQSIILPALHYLFCGNYVYFVTKKALLAFIFSCCLGFLFVWF